MSDIKVLTIRNTEGCRFLAVAIIKAAIRTVCKEAEEHENLAWERGFSTAEEEMIYFFCSDTFAFLADAVLGHADKQDTMTSEEVALAILRQKWPDCRFVPLEETGMRLYETIDLRDIIEALGFRADRARRG
jgi:hypothetical protein